MDPHQVVIDQVLGQAHDWHDRYLQKKKEREQPPNREPNDDSENDEVQVDMTPHGARRTSKGLVIT